MGQSHLALPLLGIVMTLAPARVTAQPLFVSGTVFANIHNAPGLEQVSPFRQDLNLSGTTTGGGVGVGTALGPHVVLQLELTATATLRRTFPPAEYLPPLRQPSTGTFRDIARRTKHGAILGGYRTATKARMSAALLGGVIFLQERMRSIETVTPPIASHPLPDITTVSRYGVAPIFGFDLSVSAMSRLSIVPQLRVYKATNPIGALAVWPGVSVRWAF